MAALPVRHTPICACNLLNFVLLCPWCYQHPGRRFPPTFSIGGESFFFTPNLYREGVADMIVTWSDLIQFCILIFAILAYAESKKK